MIDRKEYWAAARKRLAALRTGEKADRIPFIIFYDEPLSTRITGLTVKELLASPEILAEKSIEVGELIGGDSLGMAIPFYAGPMEADAFAKANDIKDVMVFPDYGSPFARQGVIAKTKEQIENLKIPDHSKDGYWPTMFEAAAIIKEKTGIRMPVGLSLTWSNVQELRGSKAYLDIRRNPELLLALCEKIYESQEDLFNTYVKYMGKPSYIRNTQYGFNKQMLSFEDAWKYEGQFVARMCKKHDCALQVHNCGFEPYWEEMIDKFQEEGVKVTAVEVCRPKDLNYWVEFRKKYPDMTIFGCNIYVNEEILMGTPEEVMAICKENIDALAPFGKYVLSPQCVAGWGVSLRNLMAVREAVELYGKNY